MKYFNAILAAFTVFAVVIISCSLDTPTGMPRDNPLDANNPDTHGDPYQLQAEIADGGIRLTWQAVEWEPLTGYNIYRKVDNGAFEKLIECALQCVSYTDHTIQNGHRYEYYVVVRAGDNIEGDASNVATVSINTNPVIYIEGENVTHTPTRNVNLTILAYGAREMLLSNQADFAGASWESFSSTKDWQLMTGDGTKRVYIRVVYADGDTSEVISDQIEPAAIQPTVTVNDNSEFSESRFVTLSLSGNGVTEMKIENAPFQGITSTTYRQIKREAQNTLSISKPDKLKPRSVREIGSPERDGMTEDWLPFQESIEWELLTGNDLKNVEVTVRNDFLIEETCSDQIMPRISEAHSLTIADADTVQSNHVEVSLEAQYADSMQVSGNEDFTGADWVPLRSSFMWDLGKKEFINEDRQFRSIRTVRGIRTPSRDGSDASNYSLYARVKNDFEVPSEPASATTTVEVFGDVYINNNDQYAPSRFVTLTISSEEADYYAISNDSLNVMDNPDWHDIIDHTEIQWSLLIGEGVKTVFVRFKHESGAVSRAYSDTIEPLPIEPSLSIVDDDNDGYTAVRLVDLNLSAQGSNLRMMLSEDAEFEDVDWVEYEESPEFELSAGDGEKVVYGRFINDFEIESEVVSGTILPLPLNPSIVINEDAEFTNDPNLHLLMRNVGALEMKISETEDLDDVDWIDYSEENDFEIQEGDGEREIYALFRNDFFESDVVSDEINLDTQVEIESFNWSSEHEGFLCEGDHIVLELIMADDNIGQETGGTAAVRIGDNDNEIQLEEAGAGVYELEYEIPEELVVLEAEVLLLFSDRAVNQVEGDAEDLISIVYPGFEHDFSLSEDVTITMCWIPSGEFEMGSPDNEEGRGGDEGPVHTVTFAEGFWLGKYEVTQAQWSAIMGNNPSHGRGEGDDYPVYDISWEHTQEFLDRLNEQEEYSPYRLPSESEWEYACRAGSKTRFYWGDDPNYNQIGEFAWYSANSRLETHRIGGKESNSWGLYDIIGNVQEWCIDSWLHTYRGAPNDGSPREEVGNVSRILRGGSFYVDPPFCRSAARGRNGPTNTSTYNGFRLARSHY